MTTASISEVAEILVADFLFVQNHSQLFLGLGIAPKDSQQCYNLYKLQNSSLIEITVTLLRIWISQCPEPASVGQLKSVCHQEGFIHIEDKLSKWDDTTIISQLNNENQGQTHPATKYVGSERHISIVLDQIHPEEIDTIKSVLLNMSGPQETTARKILSKLVYLDFKGVEKDVFHLIMKSYRNEIGQEEFNLGLHQLRNLYLVYIDDSNGFIQVNPCLRKDIQYDNIRTGKKFTVLNEIINNLIPIIRSPFQRVDIINHASDTFDHMLGPFQPTITMIEFDKEIKNRKKEQNIINFLKGRVDFNSKKFAEAANAFRNAYQTLEQLDRDTRELLLFGENYVLALTKVGSIQSAIEFTRKLVQISQNNESNRKLYESNLIALRHSLGRSIESSKITIAIDELSMTNFRPIPHLVIDLTDTDKCRSAYELLLAKIPTSYMNS